VSDDPAGTLWFSESDLGGALCREGKGTDMNPAPPVTMMFLVSELGSNFVAPLRMGASFQMPVSCSFAVNESG